MDVIVHNSRFLDAYEEGATSMDIVAKTRELKKRHRATLVMPDDLKSKVYRRRRRVKEDTEEIECEDGDGGDQDIGCLHELQLLETQLLAREATPAPLCNTALNVSKSSSFFGTRIRTYQPSDWPANKVVL